MAKLRFPGRPGQKHDKTGITYRSKAAKSGLNYLPTFVAAIQRGLKLFSEDVGLSDEDEEFEGFSSRDVKDAERKFREKQLEFESDGEDFAKSGKRLGRPKKSLEKLQPPERTLQRLKNVVHQSYKHMIQEGQVIKKKLSPVKRITDLVSQSQSKEKKKDKIKHSEREKPKKFKLDIKAGLVSDKFTKRKGKEFQQPIKVVKRTDKNLAKQLLQKAKQGRAQVGLKSGDKPFPHQKKQFVLPTQSSRSSRVIKPNKRFIEEDIHVVVKKKIRPESKEKESPGPKVKGQSRLIGVGVECSSGQSTQLGLLEQPLVKEGKRDRKPSQKLKSQDGIGSFRAVPGSDQSDFETSPSKSAKNGSKPVVLPTSPLAAPKFGVDLFSNFSSHASFHKATDKQRQVMDFASRKHGSSILRKAKLQLNRAALNKSKAALARSLKAQMKREARLEEERHQSGYTVISPSAGISNLSGSSSESGSAFCSPATVPMKQCIICSDHENIGHHYGVPCCDQCRKFYLCQRKQVGTRTYTCKNQGQCKITPQKKTVCLACRFMKCLQVIPWEKGKKYLKCFLSPDGKRLIPKKIKVFSPETPVMQSVNADSQTELAPMKLTLSGERREKLRKKRQAFKELLRTKQERVDSPVNEESAETAPPCNTEAEQVPSPAETSTSSPGSARGPRIKHVCRNASVVLGQPAAKFPTKSEIRLSALPVKEKKQLLKHDEAVRADLSDDERPLDEIIQQSEDSVMVIRKSPPKAVKPLRKAGFVPLGKRKIRCKQCKGCKAVDCGKCRFCRDKPKFGGSGVMKQACIDRKCLHPIYSRAATNSFLQLQQKRMGARASGSTSGSINFSDSDSVISNTESNHSSPQKDCVVRAGTGITNLTTGQLQANNQSGLVMGPRLNTNLLLQGTNTASLTHGLGTNVLSNVLMQGTSIQGSEVRRLDFGSLPSIDNTKKSYRVPTRIADNRGKSTSENSKSFKVKDKMAGRSETVVLQSVIPASRQFLSSIQNTYPIKVDFKENYNIDLAWKNGMALTTSGSLCVRTLCFLCGSAGKHDLIYCNICCEPFHEFCVDDESWQISEHRENWCCARCRFCHVCGRQNSLLQCDKCQDTYHPECLGPNYPTKPTRKGIWICTKCVKCKSCGATTPGNAWNATWTYDFSLCFECGQLMDKGNFCPVCRKCYTDDDWESKMIQCGTCESWVHAKCEGLSDEMYDILSFMPEDLSFHCQKCYPQSSKEWLTVLRREMIRGLQTILCSLTSSKCSQYIMKAEKKPVLAKAIKNVTENPHPVQTDSDSAGNKTDKDAVTLVDEGDSKTSQTVATVKESGDSFAMETKSDSAVSMETDGCGDGGDVKMVPEDTEQKCVQKVRNFDEIENSTVAKENIFKKEECQMKHDSCESENESEEKSTKSVHNTDSVTENPSARTVEMLSSLNSESVTARKNVSSEDTVSEMETLKTLTCNLDSGKLKSKDTEQSDNGKCGISKDVMVVQRSTMSKESFIKQDAEGGADKGSCSDSQLAFENRADSVQSGSLCEETPVVTEKKSETDGRKFEGREAIHDLQGEEQTYDTQKAEDTMDVDMKIVSYDNVSELNKNDTEISIDTDTECAVEKNQVENVSGNTDKKLESVQNSDDCVSADTDIKVDVNIVGIVESQKDQSNSSILTSDQSTPFKPTSDQSDSSLQKERKQDESDSLEVNSSLCVSETLTKIDCKKSEHTDSGLETVKILDEFKQGSVDQKDDLMTDRTTEFGNIFERLSSENTSSLMSEFGKNSTYTTREVTKGGHSTHKSHVQFKLQTTGKELAVPEKDEPHDLKSVQLWLDEGRYDSVKCFCEDVVRIIQLALNDPEDQKFTRKKALNSVKSIFVKHTEKIFPWFNLKTCKFWYSNFNLPARMLPDATLPPSTDHTYAQWLQREETPLSPQPSPFKKRSATPVKRMAILDDEEGETPILMDGEDSRRCLLCGNFGDKEPNEAGRLLYCSQDDWVHINCALWSAEVFEDSDGSLQNVMEAYSRGKMMRCDLCSKTGATVGCCTRGCPANYHFMCARQDFCNFQEDKQVFCKLHTGRVDGELVGREKFRVLRRVFVNQSNERLMKKTWAKGLNSSDINILIGSCTIEKLGYLTELSDRNHNLLPVDFMSTRIYWSTLDARRRCVYTCRIMEVRPVAKNSPTVTIRDMRIIHDESHPEYVPLNQLNLEGLPLGGSNDGPVVDLTAEQEHTVLSPTTFVDLSSDSTLTAENVSSFEDKSNGDQQLSASFSGCPSSPVPESSSLSLSWPSVKKKQPQNPKLSVDLSLLSPKTLKWLNLKDPSKYTVPAPKQPEINTDDDFGLGLTKIADRLNQAAARNSRRKSEDRTLPVSDPRSRRSSRSPSLERITRDKGRAFSPLHLSTGLPTEKTLYGNERPFSPVYRGGRSRSSSVESVFSQKSSSSIPPTTDQREPVVPPSTDPGVSREVTEMETEELEKTEDSKPLSPVREIPTPVHFSSPVKPDTIQKTVDDKVKCDDDCMITDVTPSTDERLDSLLNVNLSDTSLELPIDIDGILSEVSSNPSDTIIVMTDGSGDITEEEAIRIAQAAIEKSNSSVEEAEMEQDTPNEDAKTGEVIKEKEEEKTEKDNIGENGDNLVQEDRGLELNEDANNSYNHSKSIAGNHGGAILDGHSTGDAGIAKNAEKITADRQNENLDLNANTEEKENLLERDDVGICTDKVDCLTSPTAEDTELLPDASSASEHDGAKEEENTEVCKSMMKGQGDNRESWEKIMLGEDTEDILIKQDLSVIESPDKRGEVDSEREKQMDVIISGYKNKAVTELEKETDSGDRVEDKDDMKTRDRQSEAENLDKSLDQTEEHSEDNTKDIQPAHHKRMKDRKITNFSQQGYSMKEKDDYDGEDNVRLYEEQMISEDAEKEQVECIVIDSDSEQHEKDECSLIMTDRQSAVGPPTSCDEAMDCGTFKSQNFDVDGNRKQFCDSEKTGTVSFVDRQVTDVKQSGTMTDLEGNDFLGLEKQDLGPVKQVKVSVSDMEVDCVSGGHSDMNIGANQSDDEDDLCLIVSDGSDSDIEILPDLSGKLDSSFEDETREKEDEDNRTTDESKGETNKAKFEELQIADDSCKIDSVVVKAEDQLAIKSSSAVVTSEALKDTYLVGLQKDTGNSMVCKKGDLSLCQTEKKDKETEIMDVSQSLIAPAEPGIDTDDLTKQIVSDIKDKEIENIHMARKSRGNADFKGVDDSVRTEDEIDGECLGVATRPVFGPSPARAEMTMKKSEGNVIDGNDEVDAVTLPDIDGKKMEKEKVGPGEETLEIQDGRREIKYSRKTGSQQDENEEREKIVELESDEYMKIKSEKDKIMSAEDDSSCTSKDSGHHKSPDKNIFDMFKNITPDGSGGKAGLEGQEIDFRSEAEKREVLQGLGLWSSVDAAHERKKKSNPVKSYPLRNQQVSPEMRREKTQQHIQRRFLTFSLDKKRKTNDETEIAHLTHSDTDKANPDLPVSDLIAQKIKLESLAKSSPGEKGPFKCSKCRRMYRTEASFMNHVKNCDFEVSTSEEENESSSDQEEENEDSEKDESSPERKPRSSLRKSTMVQRVAMEMEEKQKLAMLSHKGNKMKRKSSSDSKHLELESRSTEEVVKKRRGRPPKSQNSTLVLETSPKVSSPGKSQENLQKSESPTAKRGRGRPRRSSVGENISDSQKLETGISPRSETKKGPGRPPKKRNRQRHCDYNSHEEDKERCHESLEKNESGNDNEYTVKRRGRPRKQAVEIPSEKSRSHRISLQSRGSSMKRHLLRSKLHRRVLSLPLPGQFGGVSKRSRSGNGRTLLRSKSGRAIKSKQHVDFVQHFPCSTSNEDESSSSKDSRSQGRRSSGIKQRSRTNSVQISTPKSETESIFPSSESKTETITASETQEPARRRGRPPKKKRGVAKQISTQDIEEAKHQDDPDLGKNTTGKEQTIKTTKSDSEDLESNGVSNRQITMGSPLLNDTSSRKAAKEDNSRDSSPVKCCSVKSDSDQSFSSPDRSVLDDVTGLITTKLKLKLQEKMRQKMKETGQIPNDMDTEESVDRKTVENVDLQGEDKLQDVTEAECDQKKDATASASEINTIKEVEENASETQGNENKATSLEIKDITGTNSATKGTESSTSVKTDEAETETQSANIDNETYSRDSPIDISDIQASISECREEEKPTLSVAVLNLLRDGHKVVIRATDSPRSVIWEKSGDKYIGRPYNPPANKPVQPKRVTLTKSPTTRSPAASESSNLGKDTKSDNEQDTVQQVCTSKRLFSSKSHTERSGSLEDEESRSPSQDDSLPTSNCSSVSRSDSSGINATKLGHCDLLPKTIQTQVSKDNPVISKQIQTPTTTPFPSQILTVLQEMHGRKNINPKMAVKGTASEDLSLTYVGSTSIRHTQPLRSPVDQGTSVPGPGVQFQRSVTPPLIQIMVTAPSSQPVLSIGIQQGLTSNTTGLESSFTLQQKQLQEILQSHINQQLPNLIQTGSPSLLPQPSAENQGAILTLPGQNQSGGNFISLQMTDQVTGYSMLQNPLQAMNSAALLPAQAPLLPQTFSPNVPTVVPASLIGAPQLQGVTPSLQPSNIQSSFTANHTGILSVQMPASIHSSLSSPLLSTSMASSAAVSSTASLRMQSSLENQSVTLAMNQLPSTLGQLQASVTALQPQDWNRKSQINQKTMETQQTKAAETLSSTQNRLKAYFSSKSESNIVPTVFNTASIPTSSLSTSLSAGSINSQQAPIQVRGMSLFPAKKTISFDKYGQGRNFSSKLSKLLTKKALSNKPSILHRKRDTPSLSSENMTFEDKNGIIHCHLKPNQKSIKVLNLEEAGTLPAKRKRFQKIRFEPLIQKKKRMSGSPRKVKKFDHHKRKSPQKLRNMSEPHCTGIVSHPILHAQKYVTSLPQAAVEEEVHETPLVALQDQNRGQDGSENSSTGDGAHLEYEITSDDGFSCKANTIDGAWKQVIEKVQDARSAARLKQLSYGGLNGLLMYGLVHNSVRYILEQLHGANYCRRYRFKYHRHEVPEMEEEPADNPSGSIRTEPFTGRKPYDMFSFLMSRYRLMPMTIGKDGDEEMVHKSSRRATSMDLPMAMRFRKLQEHSREAVGVYRSYIHGRGLFCKRNIDGGEMIIEYAGEVIRSSLTDIREKYYESKGIGCYMFRIDDIDVVDATMRGSAARFINHSCEPNCYSKVITVEQRKHIVIFAMRPIKRGEELTYDYKFPIEEVKIPCTCGSKKCRKYLN